MAIPVERRPAAHFDPSVPSPGVIGDPIGGAARWMRAEPAVGTGVAAQLAVLGGGVPPAEARARRWYIAGGGTTWAALGRILESAGLIADRARGVTFLQVEDALIAGRFVLAVVDAATLDASAGGEGYDSPPGHRPARVVEVIGLDWTHPAGEQVVVNDAARPDGAALLVPMDGFGEAWDRWQRRALIVTRP